MKQEINEIEVNGVKYVRADSLTTPLPMSNVVIVRSHGAGVFLGYIKHELKDGVIVLTHARRLWKWSGAASLSQLATDGTSDPGNCKFPTAVSEITITNVLEVISCTEKAVKSIGGVPTWQV